MATRRQKERRKKHSASGAMAKWKEKAGSGDFSSLFDLPEGVKKLEVESTGAYFLDIIPYVSENGNEFVAEGEYWWEKTFHIHRGVGVNDEWVICPARTLKKPCPVCEFRAKLADDPEADEKTVDALKPSKRIICNVVNLKKDKETVSFMHMPHWYFGRELKIALDSAFEDHEDNMEEFFLPENHSYLKCLVEAADAGYSGYKVARIDFKSSKDLDEDILEQATNLDDVLVIKDYDELKEMLYAGSDDDDGEEDEPKRKKSKKSSKKKHRKKEEEEEPEEDLDDDNGDGDEDWDGDEDEPERKKKKKKSKKKRRREAEDEDEPKGKKKKKKKSKKKRRRNKEPEEEEDWDDDSGEDWDDDNGDGDEDWDD